VRYVVLSDIHSNCYALDAVLQDVAREPYGEILILGDVFGYLPWAIEVYRRIRDLPLRTIRGNHDALVLAAQPPDPCPAYWELARNNALELANRAPEALAWLESLAPQMDLDDGERRITLCHGTPVDAEEGRFYPDDRDGHDWLPSDGAVLMLGHTHYPMARHTSGGGLVLNPGSVGQPRDGNPMPSWATFDSSTLEVVFHRTAYDIERAMALLEDMRWDPRTVASLNKDYIGPLRYPISKPPS
jgi:predicted phosphodiesterase